MHSLKPLRQTSCTWFPATVTFWLLQTAMPESLVPETWLPEMRMSVHVSARIPGLCGFGPALATFSPIILIQLRFTMLTRPSHSGMVREAPSSVTRWPGRAAKVMGAPAEPECAGTSVSA